MQNTLNNTLIRATISTNMLQYQATGVLPANYLTEEDSISWLTEEDSNNILTEE